MATQKRNEVRERPSLRRSLSFALGDGLFHEAVNACSTGAILTAWALYLEASPVLLGVLVALPYLAQPFHFVAAYLTERFGPRRMSIIAFAITRQSLLPLVLLPFLPISMGAKQSILLCASAVGALSGVIANNAWVAWMGDLIPKVVRGRYYGRRYALGMLGAALATYLAGSALDIGRAQGEIGIALAAVAGVMGLLGALSTYCLVQQHQPPRTASPVHLGLKPALVPFRDPQARSMLLYQFTWNAAVAITGGFTSAHFATELHLKFGLIALHSASASGFRVLTSQLWGRVVDRFGARPVLVVCSFGIVLMPVFQFISTPTTLWPLVLDAVLGGILWAGHSVASFSLPFQVAPPKGRAVYLAAFTAVGGLGYSMSSIGAGALAESVPADFILFGRPMTNFQLLFLLGAFARFFAATLSLRIVEPGSDRVRALIQQAVTPVSSRVALLLGLERR